MACVCVVCVGGGTNGSKYGNDINDARFEFMHKKNQVMSFKKREADSLASPWLQLYDWDQRKRLLSAMDISPMV
jgi:hypothetical protein